MFQNRYIEVDSELDLLISHAEALNYCQMIEVSEIILSTLNLALYGKL